jgi:hypothetical protein
MRGGGGSFTVVELGCGWACWLNITGIVAKRKGLKVRLVGIEGDEGHVAFAHESLAENGFDASEYTIYHGIASGGNGFALFPIQERSGVSWGLEPLFDVSAEESDKLLKTGKYQRLKQLPLNSLFSSDEDRIDLLHIDIQGGETALVQQSIGFLNEKVAMMLIGTHSRQIEGKLFDLLINSGWVLEVERPAVLSLGKDIYTLVDGVQLWRNPNLVSDQQANAVMPAEKSGTIGKLEILECPSSMKCSGKFDICVKLTNESASDWRGDTSVPVRLSYHWMNEDGSRCVVFDGVRTDLLGLCLDANTSSTQSMRIEAPTIPGKYRLVATVVQELVYWFEDRGFEVASREIEIV